MIASQEAAVSLLLRMRPIDQRSFDSVFAMQRSLLLQQAMPEQGLGSSPQTRVSAYSCRLGNSFLRFHSCCYIFSVSFSALTLLIGTGRASGLEKTVTAA